MAKEELINPEALQGLSNRDVLLPGNDLLPDLIPTVPEESRADISQLDFSDLMPTYGDTYGTTLKDVDHESYTKYIDEPFSYISDDPDDLRAYKQSTGEKIAYGVPKFVTKVGANILGSTVGLLYGGASFLGGLADPEKSAGKQFFDNDFQRGLDGINEWMDEKLPHYYTKEEQDYNFWQSMGTANFWWNDFAQGASFVTGAVLSELLTAGVATTYLAPRAALLMQRFGKVIIQMKQKLKRIK